LQRQKENDLTGKVAIITGASRGLGKQAALDFARRGANVVLAARTVEPGAFPGTLGEAIQQIEAMGGQAIAVPTDLAKEDDLKRLVQAAVDRFGGVDILVNNAAATMGSMWSKKFLDLSREEWLYQFDVNVHAPFTLMQQVTPIMQKRGGGRIINVTTGSHEVFRMPEEFPLPMENDSGVNLLVPGYFASKRALDRLASVIAPSLAATNVFVIGLMPGWVATEITLERMDKGKPQADDGPKPVPTTLPSRMLVYFAACENPAEYSGRIFFAERELATLGLEHG
jgi:NAD(P)-dependent dehydrogenase (short-subunit alcohol dehydrogenase family)